MITCRLLTPLEERRMTQTQFACTIGMHKNHIRRALRLGIAKTLFNFSP
jgi:hypothetical protein